MDSPAFISKTLESVSLPSVGFFWGQPVLLVPYDLFVCLFVFLGQTSESLNRPTSSYGRHGYLQPFFLMMFPRITSALKEEKTMSQKAASQKSKSQPSATAIPFLNSQSLQNPKIEALSAGSTVSTVSACAGRIRLPGIPEALAKCWRWQETACGPDIRNRGVIWQLGPT